MGEEKIRSNRCTGKIEYKYVPVEGTVREVKVTTGCQIYQKHHWVHVNMSLTLGIIWATIRGSYLCCGRFFTFDMSCEEMNVQSLHGTS